MILTCPKCMSKYDVDSVSIPEEGMYAHCATCENIFFVKKRKKTAAKPVPAAAIETEKPQTAAETAMPISVINEAEQTPAEPADSAQVGTDFVPEEAATPPPPPPAAKTEPAKAAPKKELSATDINSILDGVTDNLEQKAISVSDAQREIDSHFLVAANAIPDTP